MTKQQAREIKAGDLVEFDGQICRVEAVSVQGINAPYFSLDNGAAPSHQFCSTTVSIFEGYDGIGKSSRVIARFETKGWADNHLKSGSIARYESREITPERYLALSWQKGHVFARQQCLDMRPLDNVYEICVGVKQGDKQTIHVLRNGFTGEANAKRFARSTKANELVNELLMRLAPGE